MIYPWDKFLNLGIVTHTLALSDNNRFEEEVLEIVKFLAGDLFFNNLEISEIKQGRIREDVKEVIQMSHMDTIFGAGSTIFAEELDLNSFNENTRMKAVKRVKGLVDMAYFFKSKKFAITSGFDVGISKRGEAKKILEDSIFNICQYLKEHSDRSGGSMSVILETFDREYTHKLLIGPTSEAVEIVSNIRRDFSDIGLMLDLGHQPLIGEKMDYAVKQAHDYLKHVHIGNCVLKNKDDPRFGDTHPYLGYPGGENDVEEIAHFLETLKENNYFDKANISKINELPTINFEIIRKPGDDVALLIANIKRVFAKAWELCDN